MTSRTSRSLSTSGRSRSRGGRRGWVRGASVLAATGTLSGLLIGVLLPSSATGTEREPGALRLSAPFTQTRSEEGTDAAGDGASGAGSVAVRAAEPTGHRAMADDHPSVEMICRAAVSLALAEPERAQGFLRRARLAGWLPEVHFRVYRRFARTEGLTFADMGTGTVAPVDIDAVDDVRYEWRASWDLSRMVFNPDELQAHIEALRMADVRRDIQSLVIKLYFERLRLLSEGASATSASPTAIIASAEKRGLRIAEIEAQLDALSAGAFSGALTEKRPAPGPAAATP